MTRKEIVDFLHEECSIYKKDLSTIKDIIEIGSQKGFNIIKNGIDDYELQYKCVIKDFTKPLKIYRDLPDDSNNFNTYNGVYIKRLIDAIWSGGYFNEDIWCYLANKNDGDFILFEDFDDSPEKIAYCFDMMSAMSYIHETDNFIEFYLYGCYMGESKWCRYYLNHPENRLTPLKYK